MAFKIGKNKAPISEINVTPLVDVMLVLLVIFMITAPLIFSGIELRLPKTKEVNRVNLTPTQIVLSISKSSEFFLGNNKILPSEMIGAIKTKIAESKSNILFLRADFGLRYGKIAQIMSSLKRAGITNIALVTEIDEGVKL